jgi:hypothetical protein
LIRFAVPQILVSIVQSAIARVATSLAWRHRSRGDIVPLEAAARARAKWGEIDEKPQVPAT